MNNNKKIIYINGRFLTQDITGVQRYAIEVVKQLDKTNLDYKIIILTPKTETITKLNLSNIAIKQIGNFKGHLWEQISLPIYILKNNRKAKLINMCNLAPILFPGYVVIHDISFKTHPEHLDRKFSTWYRVVTKLNIKRYKHIFTVSNFSKNEITENYKVDLDRVTVTYCSAEHLKEIKSDQSIIKKLDLGNKDFCFSLGSKSPHKNHQYVIECAKKNPDILFVISGKSNDKVFKADSKEECSEKNIMYTGYLKDEELKALYQKCKAFIFPSLYEGFGIPPLEAMVSDCNNILLSNISVLEEIYGNAVSYINLNEEDCYNIIDKINENKKVNRAELLNKYSWNKVINTLVNKIID